MAATGARASQTARSGGVVVARRPARSASSAGATVLNKTFQFSVCVAGAKKPDACKNSGADAHLVVSDDKMESLDAKIGRAASILPLPGKGAPSPSGRGDRHQRCRGTMVPDPSGL